MHSNGVSTKKVNEGLPALEVQKQDLQRRA